MLLHWKISSGTQQGSKPLAALPSHLLVNLGDACSTIAEERQQSIAEYKKGKTTSIADARDMMQPKEKPKVNLMGGGVRPMGLDGRIQRKVQPVAAIQTPVCFDERSCAIKDEFKPQLRAVGEGVRDQIGASGRVGLLIEGHTDRRGPLERNEKLSLDRADSIKNWLVENCGLDPSRLRTVGYGQRRPFASSDDAAGWALNRRVEFKRIDDVRSYH